MNELKELSIEELRMVKFQLVGQIQELQVKTRLIDKEVKARLKCLNS